MKQNTSKPFKGLYTDCNPEDQPQGTYRYALNTVDETSEGGGNNRHNEGSNISVTNLTEGFTIVGSRYLEDNTVVLISVNSEGRTEIGTFDKSNNYKVLVNTATIKGSLKNQVDITYRVRRGNEKVIYWVDGVKARSLNINRLSDYYSTAYQHYLDIGGDPDTYTSEKWEEGAFDLIKTYTSIPYISNIEVRDFGKIQPGSLNFGIQYLDEDLNPSEVVSISNTVNIYNSSLDSSYDAIRGSNNVNEFQKFPEANKSVKLFISNLDESFPYYRVAIIQATAGTGQANKVLFSQPTSTKSGIFVYSGNDDVYELGDLNSLGFDTNHIYKPQHIEQLENRLLLANTEGSPYNWCKFQKYASRIGSDLVTRPVILNTLDSDANVKNAKSTFFYRGYLPGEVYSFGIVYIMKDNTLSPVFHIPGKSLAHISDMKVYEASYTYPDLHKCMEQDYWGIDVDGTPLLGHKVRHHKFPTRQEAGIPLITSTTSTIGFFRHILRVTFTLKSGKTYPVDSSNNPILIGYQADYKITGEPTSEYNNQLAEHQLGIPITILDITLPDTDTLDEINPPHYAEINAASQILVEYGDDFDITYSYEKQTADSIDSATQSRIFGIEFSNIQKPHEDVIGFYVVRNEVLDQDKIVVDNCIIGPNVKEKDYSAFTHITPAFSTSKFDTEAMWLFSPEVNFHQKNLQFNKIESQGFYETTVIHPPSQTFYEKGSGPINGIWINDVQAGTSYNAEVHKKRDKDSDGFSLHVGYKSSEFKYIHSPTSIPKPKSSIVLNAASNKLEDGIQYYNVSCDNKITITTLNSPLDPNIFKASGTVPVSVEGRPSLSVTKSKLIYATLKSGYYDGSGNWVDNDVAYQDFLTRPYYKEHMRPIYFGVDNIYNGFQIYNGDSAISSMNFITSMFRQLKVENRRGKTSLWKYIVGAVLIASAVALVAFSAAASTPISASIISGALSLMASGAMFIHSGVTLDNAIAMFDEHYDKGLLKAVEDDVVINQMGSPVGESGANKLNLGDDAIQWFVDRASNIYIESRVAFGLRAGISTHESTDFLDAPSSHNDSSFYNYIVEKLTYFDREQGGGRMYRGISNAEVYSMNPDYLRFNKEKSYIHLPTTFTCCTEDGETSEKFPTRVWYSNQSFQEEKTDNYKIFLPNNYRDIEGENGEITDLYKIGNVLYIQSEEALWKLPQNLQEKASGSLNTYIGTGEFFSVAPLKIVDDSMGSSGTRHKWGTIKTKFGVVSISEIDHKVNLHSEGITDISALGNTNFFKNNLRGFLTESIYNSYGVDYPLDNNPVNPTGVGYISIFDPRLNRVIITKKDWNLLQVPRTINKETVDLTPPANVYLYTEVVFNTYYNEFWYVDHHDGGVERVRGMIKSFEDYPEIFENKSFTISFSFNSETKSWNSFHSYLPNHYFSNQDNFYSIVTGDSGIWEHNNPNNFQTFYGKTYPHIIEYVSNSSPTFNRTWEDISLITSARTWDSNKEMFIESSKVTFTSVVLSNSRQCSGELTIIPKDNSDSDYLYNQVTNSVGTIIADNNEGIWSINNLRDYVVDYDTPYYSRNWTDLQPQFPIDKVINYSVIDYNKNWDEIEVFRDKYLNIRLKFDNFANISLTTKLSIETENLSQR